MVEISGGSSSSMYRLLVIFFQLFHLLGKFNNNQMNWILAPNFELALTVTIYLMNNCKALFIRGKKNTILGRFKYKQNYQIQLYSTISKFQKYYSLIPPSPKMTVYFKPNLIRWLL